MTSATVRRKKRKDEIKITVAPFRSQADYKACVGVQQEAFGLRDIDVIPLPMLVSANSAGGILLGAYSGLGEMIGFTFSVLGTRCGKPIQHCCLVVTKTAYKNFDIGFKLQTALREEALKRKITCITCAFDPMQPLHSYFFLGKLNFHADAYEENHYGEPSSQDDRGFPTDRMAAVWHLDDDEVAKRLGASPPRHDFRKELKHISFINQLLETAPGLFVSSSINMNCAEKTFLFEVPYNLPEIKNRNWGVAMEWQRNLRQVFCDYFKKGYVAVDFWAEERDSQLRVGYLLGKGK